MKTPHPKFVQREIIEQLANELGLPYHENMQDWSYEVADPNDIERYLNHYESLSDNNKKKIPLMEMIIQANNDQDSQEKLITYWNRVKQLLKRDFDIHQYTIFYWLKLEPNHIAEPPFFDEWPLPPYLRKEFNFNDQ